LDTAEAVDRLVELLGVPGLALLGIGASTLVGAGLSGAEFALTTALDVGIGIVTDLVQSSAKAVAGYALGTVLSTLFPEGTDQANLEEFRLLDQRVQENILHLQQLEKETVPALHQQLLLLGDRLGSVEEILNSSTNRNEPGAYTEMSVEGITTLRDFLDWYGHDEVNDLAELHRTSKAQVFDIWKNLGAHWDPTLDYLTAWMDQYFNVEQSDIVQHATKVENEQAVAKAESGKSPEKIYELTEPTPLGRPFLLRFNPSKGDKGVRRYRTTKFTPEKKPKAPSKVERLEQSVNSMKRELRRVRSNRRG
jgi:hypothetical protein